MTNQGKRVRITDLHLTSQTDRRLQAAGFEPSRDVTEVMETDGVYTSFEAWLTERQIQVLKEQNDTDFQVLDLAG